MLLSIATKEQLRLLFIVAHFRSTSLIKYSLQHIICHKLPIMCTKIYYISLKRQAKLCTGVIFGHPVYT